MHGDGKHDPDDSSGQGADVAISKAFTSDPAKLALPDDTPLLFDPGSGRYDALFIADGRRSAITMVEDGRLHGFDARFYEAGRITAASAKGPASC